MQQRLRVDGDIFENAPRVDADIFMRIKNDAFSKISGYVWTRPMSMPFYFPASKIGHTYENINNAIRN